MTSYDIKMIIKYEKEAHVLEEDSGVDWSGVIFVPFHPVFRLLVLFSVIIKCFLGPLQAVYPIVYCTDTMDIHPVLSFIKYFYWYGCDFIYGIDTFLHIVHRQVTDKAMRREYLPKSALLILLDILSLVPFFRLLASDICPAARLWPNLMAFNEFLIVYRCEQYFSLATNHSYCVILVGFTIIFIICVNCVACFWLLLTYEGLCDKCSDSNYDWRSYVNYKFNETNEKFSTYVYGAAYILTFALNLSFDETRPHTILEFKLTCLFVVIGYLLMLFIIFPKAFSEALLRIRRIAIIHPNAKKNIGEAKRRNASIKPYQYVKNFYTLMWKKRNGVAKMPDVIVSIPRYLRLEITQDLAWQLFYHSPTLRKTSNPFKRWLCDYIQLDYKLPGERFYTGPNCISNLYYIKSGVVQLLSIEDGTTPILTFTSGTILGDVSFLLPPLRKKIIMHCLTFCEIVYVERTYILRALYNYQEDQKLIMNQTYERLEHAKNLYTCKLHIRGLDRAEDEGIAWIKMRWWQISVAVHKWKKESSKCKDNSKCVIPAEESIYHCAKYIGQLVLCTEEQLQTKSMFANIKFPWILNSDSMFGAIWHRIVVATVFGVLFSYPPNLTRAVIPGWFTFFQCITNFVYTTDICVSLMTCLSGQESDAVSFTTVMFARCKCPTFILDVLAAIWTESLANIIGMPDYYYTVQFNRLLKLYILFYGQYAEMNVTKSPIVIVHYKIILILFTLLYVTSYCFYELIKRVPTITMSYFFGESHCGTDKHKKTCDPGRRGVFFVVIWWTIEMMFPECLPQKLMDLYIVSTLCYFNLMVYIFCRSKLVACLYMKYKYIIGYKHFVASLKDYYKHHNIHQDLLVRLEKYLVCHWNYYKGKDVMYPNMIKDEPKHVYWRVHREVAEKIIGESKPFVGADTILIKDLANAAQFMILPNNSTIFMFGSQCRNVTWVVQGSIQCEYHDETGELSKVYYGVGEMLSVSSVFFGKASLRSYSSYTECEILYIKVKDFFSILKSHPNEWSYFENSIKEISPVYEEMFHEYIIKHRDYQLNLRRRLNSARISTKIAPRSLTEFVDDKYRSSPLEGLFWGDPNSVFMRSWFTFRAITVCVSIICASMQGSAGAEYRWSMILICAFCDSVAWIDIGLKLCLAYYDKRGLLITDKRLCLFNYLTRGFFLDVIGAVPLMQLLTDSMTQEINDETGVFVNTCGKFAHLYIVAAYFNYIGDSPMVNMSFIMILKWQVINLLVVFVASNFLVINCIDFTYDSKWNLIDMSRLTGCWAPQHLDIGENINNRELQLLFIESINLVQSGLAGINIGRFFIDRENLQIGCCLLLLGVIWWYIFCYTLTLLLLSARGKTIFQHGVDQLKRFLEGERVEKPLIRRAVSYFSYSWLRTKGVNIHKVTYERLGVVFRQDLSYCFYKRTFTVLDTVLGGEEFLVKQLASVCLQMYLMPGQEIIREMNVSPVVYIVHRGKVIVSKGGDRVITLAKGSIFGQLKGTQTRALRITATADQHVDLLYIPLKQFQDIISDEVRKTIARSTQAKYDFMSARKNIPENPYDTVSYILRGRKTIMLPWMHNPMEYHRNTWYLRWLIVVWFIEPLCSAFIAILLGTLPTENRLQYYWALGLMDFIHLGHIISEFFTMHLNVEGNKCVNRIVGTRRFLEWALYIDTLSLLTPLLTIATGYWQYQLARLLRLRLLHDFHVHFCRSFKSKLAPRCMQIMLLCLLFHTFTCGWIYVACRHEVFPISLPILQGDAQMTIYQDQWVFPTERKGGCPRLTKNLIMKDGQKRPSFVVPKHWQNDYVIGLMYFLLILVSLGIDSVVCLTIGEVYYKVIVAFIIYLVDMWICSIAVNFIYTKYRELYNYDYNVNNLITFLDNSGLSPVLSKATLTYSHQLWRRQQGNWLPELVYLAPSCLREDLFCSLYMHHLEEPPMYRNIPYYFKRQMAARLKRVVIFPDNCIIREGDIFPCTYFIHEGEVETWYTDKEGENKFHSLLYTNGYFGLISGLTYIPFQFSYYTRTVVDLIYLKLSDWQDLLDSYPEVKRELYKAVHEFRAELMKQKYGKEVFVNRDSQEINF